MRQLGRPRNDYQEDTVIGKSAEQLIIWGFPRRKVYEELRLPAAEILSRVDSNVLPLSGDRIEQIHEEWKKKIKEKNIEKRGFHWSFQRCRYTKRSLINGRPKVPLKKLIITLLKNDGEWSEWPPNGYISSDPELAPKAEKELEQFPRLVRKKYTRRPIPAKLLLYPLKKKQGN